MLNNGQDINDVHPTAHVIDTIGREFGVEIFGTKDEEVRES